MWILLPFLLPYMLLYPIIWPFEKLGEGLEELKDRLGKYIDFERVFG